MKRLLLLAFCFTTTLCSLNSIQAQSSLERAAIIYKYKKHKPLSNSKRKEFQDFIQADYQRLNGCDTKKCKIGYLFRMASVHYILDSPNDSIEYLLNKSFEVDSVKTCSALRFFDPTNSPSKRLRKENSYFAREFSSDWWDKNQLNCQPIYDTLTINKKINQTKETISNIVFANELKKIEIKDQAFRDALVKDSNNDSLWTKQRANDLENRIQLDSLFLLYGFPTKEKVGKEGAMSAWLVLQHSIDCTWNEKWIERYLDHFVSGKLTGAGLIPNTIDRFYHPEKGYCPEGERKQFIQYLQNKYPPEVTYKFGFKDFYK